MAEKESGGGGRRGEEEEEGGKDFGFVGRKRKRRKKKEVGERRRKKRGEVRRRWSATRSLCFHSLLRKTDGRKDKVCEGVTGETLPSISFHKKNGY